MCVRPLWHVERDQSLPCIVAIQVNGLCWTEQTQNQTLNKTENIFFFTNYLFIAQMQYSSSEMQHLHPYDFNIIMCVTKEEQ